MAPRSRVLLFLCLAGFLSAGSSQMCIGILLPHITATTGWSSQEISGALLLGTLAGGLLSPLTGAVVDRHGGRYLMFVGVICFAAGLLVLSQAHGLITFYVGYALSRGAAQGILAGATQRAVIVRWFSSERGFALGTAAMAIPLGSATLGLSSQLLIGAGVDWRHWLVLLAGASVLVLSVPPLVMLRPRAGAGSDDRPAASARHRRTVPSRHDWAFSAIIRHWVFHAIVVASMLSIAANGALVFHHVAYLSSRGVGPMQAVTAVSALALSGAAASLLWGYLADRVSERGLAIASQALAALPIIFLTTVDSAAAAIAASAAIGMLIRGEGAIAQLLIARYFGIAAFGRTIGIMSSFQMMALGAGPFLGSVLLELSGGYRGFYWLLSAAYLAAAGIFVVIRSPQRDGAQPSAAGTGESPR